MVIVLGTAKPRSEGFEQALRISREHVERSRREPGCLSHDVCIAADRPGELLFVERWGSIEDLQRHFQVPDSRAFGRELSDLCDPRPSLRMYDATELPMP